MTLVAAVDIGGTKCAVSLAIVEKDNVVFLDKISFSTPSGPEMAIGEICSSLDTMFMRYPDRTPEAIGISCGGPLNSQAGLILSPPNLPGWDHVDVVSPLHVRYGVPVGLQNDANACALAEWRFGAGKGCRHMIFLTFGTGMGAGLILNGQLYVGKNDMAGEVGHVRLDADGPWGYGKAGSFEGFCSGGGIAKLARKMSLQAIQEGKPPSYCQTMNDLSSLTAETVGKAAEAGDSMAIDVYETVGRRLGQGIAMLIDVLNPEKIVIGSIYGRQHKLLEPLVMATLRQEALSFSLDVCEIVPAGLGEQVGDYAGVSVAMEMLRGQA
ncbi:ROK family protein [Paenibacillus chondroitinus]|uniref:ROK family protein n=1 Tax=Paenibacillus chondroitinus TaxID=59842 RepID=A0ABU6D685_9BACL|nr:MULTISPECIES: ROK family protein [Paenibacillus]MCY9660176.1 ROK family protein [Paenibacillus anseongense]MEB4792965.1 ROK family protein [Paenibacillus chondroitinus]